MRRARGGNLVIGGGFGGAYVAKLLGKQGATIVSPEGSMLYTPMLPEVAAGAIEPRHVVVPLRMMCPHAEVILGRAVGLDESTNTVSVETSAGDFDIEYDNVVIAVGAVARILPIPGLAEHGLGFKNLADAIYLRNHLLANLHAAEAAVDGNTDRHLTFVFVGAGYAGVEALAELTDLVRDVLGHYPGLRGKPQRWVLVDAGDRILGEVPAKLGEYAAKHLRKRGVDIRVSTTLDEVEEHGVTLSDGERLETNTLVWTAGVRPHPIVEELGLPLDERGRIRVDSSLRVDGRSNVWALGDCAGVPNEATNQFDPPTCQHALRQARRLAKNIRGKEKSYGYKMIGQGATLGRDRGIANLFGHFNFRGFTGSMVTRAYHLHQLPLFSRRLRVLADGMLSVFFGRDMADLGQLERSVGATRAGDKIAA
jgi:NADH dehydrogenase